MKSPLLPACALAVSLVLAGCGGSANDGGATGTPTSSTSSSPAPSPTSASPTTVESSSPAPEITTIPDSDLPQIDGFEYSSDGIDDDALLQQMGAAGGTSDGGRIEGAVVRAIKVDGQVGGVITMLRAERDYTATEARNAAIDAAAGFAVLKRADKATVLGKTVWKTTRKGSPPLYAMAWAYGDSVYLIATASASATKAAMGAVIVTVGG